MANIANKACPLCNREFSAQGLGGHMWAMHGVKVGDRARLEDVNKRVIKLEDELAKARLNDSSAPIQRELEALRSEVKTLHNMHTKGDMGLDDGKHKKIFTSES